MDFIQFWLSKYLVEALIPIAFLVAYLFLHIIPSYIKQARCKHETFHETMACDAICRSCGKNLGFIGSVRDNRSDK